MHIVHVKRDAYDAYVGRNCFGLSSEFGNPFKLHSGEARGSTLANYLGYLLANPQVIAHARAKLFGCKTLACWCAPKGGISIDDDLICHAQVLARAIRGDYDDYKGDGRS